MSLQVLYYISQSVCLSNWGIVFHCDKRRVSFFPLSRSVCFIGRETKESSICIYICGRSPYTSFWLSTWDLPAAFSKMLCRRRCRRSNKPAQIATAKTSQILSSRSSLQIEKKRVNMWNVKLLAKPSSPSRQPRLRQLFIENLRCIQLSDKRASVKF